MSETLKEIYLPYKMKIDQLAKQLSTSLSIDKEEALTLIEEQISSSEDQWIREEEKDKKFNEMMEGSIDVETV
tara:strand:+ start:104 stop:322 length:219 start_codon:yes stop_codon:yes gene_type:complete